MTKKLSRAQRHFANKRKLQVRDGKQIDISFFAEHCGFAWPVFITRDLYDKFANVAEGAPQWEQTYLDIIHVMIDEIRRLKVNARKLQMNAYIRVNHTRVRTKMVAISGPMDLKNRRHVITIMLLGEVP